MDLAQFLPQQRPQPQPQPQPQAKLNRFGGYDCQGDGRPSDISYLQWQVRQSPIMVDGAQAAGYMATVRADTGAVMGVQKSRYTPIQNEEMLALADELQRHSRAKLAAYGQVGGGGKCYVTLDHGAVAVAGDPSPIQKHTLVAWGHDGASSAIVLPTVRVRCRNTLAVALNRSKGSGLRIRHTISAAQRLAHAVALLAQAEQSHAAFLSLAEALAARKYGDSDMRGLLTKLWPGDSARSANKRESVLSRWEGYTREQGAQAWAAFQALTEELDHGGSAAGEKRANSVLFGDGATKRQVAWECLTAGLRGGVAL